VHCAKLHHPAVNLLKGFHALHKDVRGGIECSSAIGIVCQERCAELVCQECQAYYIFLLPSLWQGNNQIVSRNVPRIY
jgi:hypothetical protein